jgi:fatty-acyl-CoA synthase
MKADVISRATGSVESQRTPFSAEPSSEYTLRRIPAYALPVFVRLCRALDVIETFRRQEQRLICDGLEPSVGDLLFLRDPATGDHGSIEQAVYAPIAEAGIRF